MSRHQSRCTIVQMKPVTPSIILATLALAASPALALDFPIHGNQLNAGERVVTKVHGTGGGPQTGAKDLRILHRVADNNWRFLEDGKTDKSVNGNYLIYARPFFAMAGGTVVGCWRNAPENTGHNQRPEASATKRSCSRAIISGSSRPTAKSPSTPTPFPAAFPQAFARTTPSFSLVPRSPARYRPSRKPSSRPVPRWWRGSSWASLAIPAIRANPTFTFTWSIRPTPGNR